MIENNEIIKTKAEILEEKKLHLFDIPEKSKIECEVSDGSTYIIYDHPDGMYSYCITEKGAVVHLGMAQPLRKIIESTTGEVFYQLSK